MFSLFRARSLSKTISARLAVFARPSLALSGIGMEDAAAGGWLPPRTLGFLAALVTLMARQISARLPEHALASVQVTVLAEMTGVGPELIGEEIVLLSSSGEADFAEGAAAGAAFFASLSSIDGSFPARAGSAEARYFGGSEAGSGTDAAAADERCSHLQALWDQHVTDLLSGEHR